MTLIDKFNESLQWLLDRLNDLFLIILDAILSAAAALFNALPVPGFMLNLPSYTLPEFASWAGELAQVEFGLTTIVSAYTFRFILRRIPFLN